MEKVSEVLDRVKPEEPPALASSQPQENTRESNPLWLSETIEKYLRHWGIADDAIEASLQCMDRAKELCETMEKNQRGLSLYGSQGRGKTTLVTAILRYELERFLNKQSLYRSIQFVFVPDLLLELQSCFAPGSEKIAGDVIYRVSDYDFLVLDGMGEGGRPSGLWLRLVKVQKEKTGKNGPSENEEMFFKLLNKPSVQERPSSRKL